MCLRVSVMPEEDLRVGVWTRALCHLAVVTDDSMTRSLGRSDPHRHLRSPSLESRFPASGHLHASGPGARYGI